MNEGESVAPDPQGVVEAVPASAFSRDYAALLTGTNVPLVDTSGVSEHCKEVCGRLTDFEKTLEQVHLAHQDLANEGIPAILKACENMEAVFAQIDDMCITLDRTHSAVCALEAFVKHVNSLNDKPLSASISALFGGGGSKKKDEELKMPNPPLIEGVAPRDFLTQTNAIFDPYMKNSS